MKQVEYVLPSGSVLVFNNFPNNVYVSWSSLLLSFISSIKFNQYNLFFEEIMKLSFQFDFHS